LFGVRSRAVGSQGAILTSRYSSVYYFTSYMKNYSRMLSQRQKTRYDVVQVRLRDSWQQLAVTEFVMIQSGDFAHSDQMALQVGL